MCGNIIGHCTAAARLSMGETQQKKFFLENGTTIKSQEKQSPFDISLVSSPRAAYFATSPIRIWEAAINFT